MNLVFLEAFLGEIVEAKRLHPKNVEFSLGNSVNLLNMFCLIFQQNAVEKDMRDFHREVFVKADEVSQY